MTTGSLLLLNM